eukprot:RCo033875
MWASRLLLARRVISRIGLVLKASQLRQQKTLRVANVMEVKHIAGIVRYPIKKVVRFVRDWYGLTFVKHREKHTKIVIPFATAKDLILRLAPEAKIEYVEMDVLWRPEDEQSLSVPPVVALFGHSGHGKTALLDAMRLSHGLGADLETGEA